MKETMSIICAVALLALIGGCGDSGDQVKIAPPASGQAAPTATQATASTGVAASTETKTNASAPTETAVAASTGTSTGTGTAAPAAKEDWGTREQLGPGKQSIVMPNSWKEDPPSSQMRLRQAKLPKGDGDAEDTEFVIFGFQNNAGGLDANKSRWVKQFGGQSSVKAERTVKSSSGTTISIVELEGIYDSGMGNAEAKHLCKMIAGYIDTPEGARVFKLIGPAKTVDAHKEEFDKVVQSMK